MSRRACEGVHSRTWREAGADSPGWAVPLGDCLAVLATLNAARTGLVAPKNDQAFIQSQEEETCLFCMSLDQKQYRARRYASLIYPPRQPHQGVTAPTPVTQMTSWAPATTPRSRSSQAAPARCEPGPRKPQSPDARVMVAEEAEQTPPELGCVLFGECSVHSPTLVLRVPPGPLAFQEGHWSEASPKSPALSLQVSTLSRPRRGGWVPASCPPLSFLGPDQGPKSTLMRKKKELLFQRSVGGQLAAFLIPPCPFIPKPSDRDASRAKAPKSPRSGSSCPSTSSLWKALAPWPSACKGCVLAAALRSHLRLLPERTASCLQ